jgi:hypothetical protein
MRRPEWARQGPAGEFLREAECLLNAPAQQEK